MVGRAVGEYSKQCEVVKMLKIGYFADGPWSHNAFERLTDDPLIKIEFVCVRYDTADLTLKLFCDKHDVPYMKHENINSDDFISQVRDFNCDLFVSMSFNQIFRQEIINLSKFKIINCHAGKLPFYRGRNILNWVLINDEKEFGITVHFVDEGIDTGDIIIQKTFPIAEHDDYSSLLEIAYIACAEILCEAIDLFKAGDIKGFSQEMIHPVGFYCNQRTVGDEVLNWNQSSRNIFNFIRAIACPGPMARVFLNGSEMKINKSFFIAEAPSYIGSVGAILNKDSQGFYVKTLDSYIKITEFEFNGVVKVGDRFDV